MKHLLKTLAVATVAGIGLAPVHAWAVPTLELSSGGTTVTVTDGGAGDANPAAGAVTFVGSVGNFTINVSTGLTKPAIGSPSFPDMDLNSVNSSTLGGTLTISFSETGFTASSVLKSDVGGTTQGTASFEVYADASNALFGQGTSVASFGPFSGGAFSDQSGGVVAPAGPYSLTQIATIVHTRGPNAKTTSFDFQTTVPVPATLGLFGIGLVGLGWLGRRRSKVA